MFKPNKESEQWEAPVGVAPWRDLSDEEFEALNARLGPGLERFFDHVDDTKAKKTTAAKAAGGTE